MQRGAGTFFEIAGVYRRYHVPLCRTAFLGTPPQALLDAARAGNSAGDIARAFYAVLDRFGIQREGRCDYCIGLSYPPDWGERAVSIRPSDTTVLEPNMTFHFMPGLWMQEWGLEITESIRIRPEGPAETLANVPRPLHVVA